jgi:hypothetical protein
MVQDMFHLDFRRMNPSCVTEDAFIKIPELNFSRPGISKCPFVFNGAPMSNKPQSLTNITEIKRKQSATKDITLDSYFSEDNYYSYNLNTENIISSDQSTTLTIDSVKYTLKFICLHACLWSRNSPNPQLSIFMTAENGNMFHICIPVAYSANSPNTFLKSWLTESPVPPGFTLNQIFSFPEKKIKFAHLHYCLRYNNKKSLTPYQLIYFNTAINLDPATAPEWLLSDKSLTNSQVIPGQDSGNTYRRKTFSQVLNLFYRGTMNKIAFGTINDPYEICPDEYFNSKSGDNPIDTQADPKPIYFNIEATELLGRNKLEGFSSRSVNATLERNKLKNIKCYPIDLVHDIDDQGNISVDPVTKKAIPIQNQDSLLKSTFGPDSSKNLDNKKNQSWITFLIAFGIIMGILLLAGVLIIVYVFRGKADVVAQAAQALAEAQAQAQAQAAQTQTRIDALQRNKLANEASIASLSRNLNIERSRGPRDISPL